MKNIINKLDKLYNFLDRLEMPAPVGIIYSIISVIFVLFVFLYGVDNMYTGKNYEDCIIVTIPLVIMGVMGVWTIVYILMSMKDHYGNWSTYFGAPIRAFICLMPYISLTVRAFNPDSILKDSLIVGVIAFVSIALMKEFKNETYEPLFTNKSISPTGRRKTLALGTLKEFVFIWYFMLRCRYDSDDLVRTVKFNDEDHFERYAKTHTEEETYDYIRRVKRMIEEEREFVYKNETISCMLNNTFMFLLPYVLYIGITIAIHFLWPLDWKYYGELFSGIPFLK